MLSSLYSLGVNQIVEQHETDFLANIRNFSTSEISRSFAWIDCNNVFSLNSWETDNLAKELYRFLANWGMLHDSFLLDYNWRILRDTVNILKEEQYRIIRNPEIETVEENISLIVGLGKRIDSEISIFNDDKPVWNRLISKILLGAMGCTIAYDTNIVKFLRKHKEIASSSFSEKSLKSLCEFYKNHFEFEEERKEIKKKHGINFPPMKILDMALWMPKQK